MAEEQVVDEKTLDESLTESIRGTLAEINERGEGLDATQEVVEETPAESPKQDRPRDPEGKFTKAPKEAPKASPTQSAAPAKADTQKDAPVAAAAPEQAAAETEAPLKFGQVAVDLTRPPSSWKPAAKAAWAALPPDVQKEIYRRETDFSNTVLNGPLKESADFGKAVKQVVEPYRGLIEAEGGDYTRAIADTMKTAALFRTGSPQVKLNALFQIDQQFCNGALNQHFKQRVEEEVAKRTGQPAPAAAAPQQLADPRVDSLIEAMERQNKERAAEAQRVANAATEAFIQAKDDKGQPLYPFVDNVIDDMSMRVASLRRQNPAMEHMEALKQAYEAAVWANSETRAVLMAAQQSVAAAPVETQRKVAQARAASAGNLPKRGGLPTAGPASVLRLGTPESDESIRETLRQLTG